MAGRSESVSSIPPVKAYNINRRFPDTEPFILMQSKYELRLTLTVQKLLKIIKFWLRICSVARRHDFRILASGACCGCDNCQCKKVNHSKVSLSALLYETSKFDNTTLIGLLDSYVYPLSAEKML